MDEPVKPNDPVTSDVAAAEESPSQSDRPYQRLDEAGKKAVCEAFKTSLPDLKLAKPRQPRETKNGETIH
jgi:hypothetical protein